MAIRAPDGANKGIITPLLKSCLNNVNRVSGESGVKNSCGAASISDQFFFVSGEHT